jgi:hypothetical protein
MDFWWVFPASNIALVLWLEYGGGREKVMVLLLAEEPRER